MEGVGKIWLNAGGKKAGKCLIFGHTRFDESKFKADENPEVQDFPPQLDIDVDTIQEAFEACGMAVVPNRDLRVQQVKDEIEKFAQEDFENFGSAVVVFSSHGGKKNAIYAYDGVLDLDKDIIRPLVDSEKLKNKLIWIIIDACRGTYDEMKMKTGQSSTSGGSTSLPDLRKMIRSIDEHKDLLISYCCTQGYTGDYNDEAKENTRVGSWFIMRLADELKYWTNEVDLLSILARVTANVVQKEEGVSQSTGKPTGQSPNFLSFLPYKVLLQRDVILPSLHAYERMKYQGRAVVGGQYCHKEMAENLLPVLKALKFNAEFVRYQEVTNIETVLYENIRDRIGPNHNMFALVVFIQDHEDDQKLGPVLRQMLLAHETNNLAGRPRVILLISIESKSNKKARPVPVIEERHIDTTTELADVIIYYCRGEYAYSLLVAELNSCNDKEEDLVSMFTRINASAAARAESFPASAVPTTDTSLEKKQDATVVKNTQIVNKKTAKGVKLLRRNIIESTLTSLLILRRDSILMIPDDAPTVPLEPSANPFTE